MIPHLLVLKRALKSPPTFENHASEIDATFLFVKSMFVAPLRGGGGSLRKKSPRVQLDWYDGAAGEKVVEGSLGAPPLSAAAGGGVGG